MNSSVDLLVHQNTPMKALRELLLFHEDCTPLRHLKVLGGGYQLREIFISIISFGGLEICKSECRIQDSWIKLIRAEECLGF